MSFLETLVILIVAFIVFGPKKMPEMARKIGHWMGMLRQARENFQRQLMTMDQQVTNSLNRASDELDHLLPSDEDLESAVTHKKPLTPRDFTSDAPEGIPPPFVASPAPSQPGSAPPPHSPDELLDTAPVPGGLPPEPPPEPPKATAEAEVTIATAPYPSMAPGATPKAMPTERRVMKVHKEEEPVVRSLGLSPTKPEEKHG